MARFSLSSYSLRIKDKRTRSYVRLDNFSENLDSLNIFHNYLNSLQNNPSHDSQSKNFMRISSLNLSDSDRTFCGILEKGDYGYASTLIDVDDGSTSYERQIDDAELLPFYFLGSIPMGSDNGVILLQRFKQLGVKRFFRDYLDEHLKNEHSNFSIEFNPLIPEQVVRQNLSQGRITKVRFIKSEITSDIADAYDRNGGAIEDEGYLEFTVHAKRSGEIPILNKILDYLGGNRELNQIIEIPYFEYENVKVEVEINKNKRTIDLSDLSKIRAYYDIDGVQLSEEGHPAFDSINQKARSLLRDLSETMGLEGSND